MNWAHKSTHIVKSVNDADLLDNSGDYKIHTNTLKSRAILGKNNLWVKDDWKLSWNSAMENDDIKRP